MRHEHDRNVASNGVDARDDVINLILQRSDVAAALVLKGRCVIVRRNSDAAQIEGSWVGAGHGQIKCRAGIGRAMPVGTRKQILPVSRAAKTRTEKKNGTCARRSSGPGIDLRQNLRDRHGIMRQKMMSKGGWRCCCLPCAARRDG